MKKIMFNDQYGLTKAVLDGRKTMTRRLAPVKWAAGDWHDEPIPYYKVGEIVAIAQCYRVIYTGPGREFGSSSNNSLGLISTKGWDNKMYVRADLMRHQIEITGVKIERLNEISEEDALKEGVYGESVLDAKLKECYAYTFSPALQHYDTAREAFAILIDKVSGNGTWVRNPWVFVYSFKLVK